MSKRRIVGIACFYEQYLKETNHQHINYGLHEHEEAERLKAGDCDEELKHSNRENQSSSVSKSPTKNTILIGMILLHVH